jgi:NADH-quinone oxidoreductase subunit M
MDWNLAFLPFIPALPLAGGLVALLTRNRSLAAGLVLVATLASLGMAGAVCVDRYRLATDAEMVGTAFTAGQPHFELGSVFGGDKIFRLRLGIDGLNAALVLLTGLIGVLSVLASLHLNLDRAGRYFGLLGVLIGLTHLAFLAQDLLLFYVAFELTLIPLFLLVGIWGGANRQAASLKMVIYTLSGGLLTLLGILALGTQSGLGFEFGWEALARRASIATTSAVAPGRIPLEVVFLLLCAGFVVKIPLVPFHSWQPLAYAEAPTPVTAFLSAVLAKLGLYGLLRVCFFLLPGQAAHIGIQVLVPLSVLSIVYGAFCAFGARDLKSLLAYGSISHLGVALLGMLSFNRVGLDGALLHMLAHGVITAGLLFTAGMLGEREGTLQFSALGGLASKHRLLAAFLVLFALASVGVPGLAQFGGEFLCLMGFLGSAEYGQGIPVALGVLAGVFLGGWYTVTMLQRVLFGPLKTPAADKPFFGLGAVDWAILAPLALLTIILGVWPKPVLSAARVETGYLERQVHRMETGNLASR